MAQILDPLPSGKTNRILCCYVNATSKVQIARITNIDNWYFERVVFPGQRLVFEAVPEALLEIHTGMMASAILDDTIPCTRLRVDEGEDSPVDYEPETKTENKNEIVSQTDRKSRSFATPLITAVNFA
ncbi:MAG: DUF1830 domain-containing protein [Oscillatoria sp. PMC 1051.18]|uniref:DUF1830 domain-containing protein n=1 Tax=Oscillatoria salina TaxID=331517 RepID=UPI0013B82345|nr:DUF1830 domain-containing protein [Oscillatoria salina]MBZ8181834.1 DUF1830 domain-containing protein [Oscillatoria salina IIICB1]MEC4891692.1 DUF1830 domain-containing protein [Oscillatoria sp. PMC 1050.18]MEC5028356.1 DUF1830 domain-containing protein [Oscillatoria sp. PMC 1051.18]NET87054.1 DUF1830 domain-containing protein [Kamptonema sp. SIO1D9]